MAYGNNIILGVGARPPGVTTRPSELIVYSMFNNAYQETLFPRQEYDVLPIPNRPTRQAMSSHTEVSISYHESANRFIVAYVDLNSNVRLLSLDGITGRPIDTSGALLLPTDTTFDSVLPARVVCDAHAPQAYSFCYLYLVPTSGGLDSIFDGAFIRATVNVSQAGQLTVNSATAVESSALAALLIKGGTYGANASAPQPASGFFLNVEPFSSASLNEVRFMFDDVGVFSSSIGDGFSSTYMTLTTVAPAGYRSNLSSMDWNEALQRFVVVTAR